MSSLSQVQEKNQGPRLPRIAVILAGGMGTRLRPFSTDKKPKQFLRFFGEKTLFQASFERLSGLFPKEHIWVLTQEAYVPLVKEQIPGLLGENIIAEPIMRNTAAALALAAHLCQRRHGKALMAVMPSDHWIEPRGEFQQTLSSVLERLASDPLIYTLGIHPEYPATGYGYLHSGEEVSVDQGVSHYSLKSFCEKPSLEKAKEFLQKGHYFWNAGILLWPVETFLTELQEHLPSHFNAFSSLDEASFLNSQKLKPIFEALESISIDYGLLEKTKKLGMAHGRFLWSDLGSWEAIAALMKDQRVLLSLLNPEVRTLLKEKDLI